MQSKWWGWGAPDKTYALEERPNAWPFLKARLGLTEEVQRPPIEEAAIQLPPPRLSAEVLEALAQAIGELNVTTQSRDRLVHAYGKSYRDLVRIRRGQLDNPPDAVVYATAEAQIEALIALAKVHGFAIIPFGGGTSVVGGLEMPESQRARYFVSLDLTRMDQLLSLDAVSQLAVVQPGILGPKLEEALQAQGFTLGHYPQSFEFSTLGGWVATRSAGQQSTRYGRIEELVKAVRVVTPQGVLDTRPLPAAAQGPDLNQIAIGSEGIYGVITQVTVHVRPQPERRDYRALLFKDWTSGQAAIRAIMQGDRRPATLRLSDARETQAYMKLGESRPARGVRKWLSNAVKWYLARMKDVHAESACLMIMGFEGSPEKIEQDRTRCQMLAEQNHGVSLGHGPAEKWYAGRFELPYLRDVLLDRGVLVDTLETSGTWEALPGLYEAVSNALEGAIRADGLAPLVFCHVSHPYAIGASLYFTFAAKQIEGDELGQWGRYKQTATDAILAHGGALSHHHSVGLDHAPWIREALGVEGLAWLRGLKHAIDPEDLMNPGKIIGNDRLDVPINSCDVPSPSPGGGGA